MKATGFVFARGGSKGIPRKNLRSLAGKPLIAHSIETALASRWIDRVVVSTDDVEIANVARQYGAEVPFLRPADLATDSASEWLAWKHALACVDEASPVDPVDIFVSVPATCPLRSVDDIDACIEKLIATSADLVLTVTESRRSPYFNMLVLAEDGAARLVIPTEKSIDRRQDAPHVYDITTGVYVARADYVRSAKSLLAGRVHAVVVPPERSVDIDCEMDFQYAEFLLGQTAGQRRHCA